MYKKWLIFQALLCVDLLLRQLGYELLHHATTAKDEGILEVAKLVAGAQEVGL